MEGNIEVGSKLKARQERWAPENVMPRLALEHLRIKMAAKNIQGVSCRANSVHKGRRNEKIERDPRWMQGCINVPSVIDRSSPCHDNISVDFRSVIGKGLYLTKSKSWVVFQTTKALT